MNHALLPDPFCRPMKPRVALSALRSQEGSAYIVTLMVLLILTILGLSLSLITQTEAMTGKNEGVIQSVFYAADSGVGIATVKVLSANDHRSQSFSVSPERAITPAQQLVDLTEEVEISPIFPIRDSPCNLCQINQGSDFLEINHAVTTTATRMGRQGGGEGVPLGRKTISVMVEIQPWQLSPQAFFVDESELENIKF